MAEPVTGGQVSSEAVRRLFVAIDPPAAAVNHLGAVVDLLEVSRANRPGQSTRLAPRERWHVTLAFLGDVPVRRIEAAARSVAVAVGAPSRPPPRRMARQRGIAGPRGEVGPRPDADLRPDPPPQVCFAGGGTYGRGPSTILWVGLSGDVAGLRRLAEAVRQHLRQARLPCDRKSFRPHLTISRPGTRVSREQVESDVATLGSYGGPTWTVEAVHLYASETVLTQTGPQPHYTRLATVATRPPLT